MSPQDKGAQLRAAGETSDACAIPTFEADGCVMARWRDVAVVVWATQATAVHIAEFERLAELMFAEYPRVSTVQLLTRGASVPTPEAREALNGLIERHASKLICCATTLEGAGFWASTMRSFLTGLQLFQRNHFKTKICASHLEAAHWLATLHPLDSAAEAQLVSELTQLRARPSVNRG